MKMNSSLQNSFPIWSSEANKIHYCPTVQVWTQTKLHEFPLPMKVEHLIFGRDGGSVNI